MVFLSPAKGLARSVRFVAVLTALGGTALAQIPFQNVVVDAQGADDMHSKAAGDLNGDGFVDLLVASRNGEIYWYDDRSNPGTWTRHVLATGGGGWSTDAEIGDIDNDGDNDVVVSDWYGQSRIAYFRNDGGGNSWTQVTIGAPKAHDIELADMDGDGDLDVVTREQGTQGRKIKLWRQNSPTSWSVTTFLPPSVPEGEGLKVGDLDGDGDPDIVLPSYWLENTGSYPSGMVERRFTSQFPTVEGIVALGDMNGDGRVDIAMTPAEAAGQFGAPTAWFEQPTNVESSNWTRHTIEAGIEHVTHALQIGDVDADGDLDVVTAEMHQGIDPDEVRVYANNGNGSAFTKQVIGTAGSHSIRLIDIDNDGDLDVFGANWEQSTRVDVWINGGNSGGGPVVFCEGLSGCPCGNTGGPDEGCQNSTGDGAFLNYSGSLSISSDTLVLRAGQMVPGTFCMMFHGASTIQIPYASGKLCIGGGLQRYQLKSTGNGSAIWGPGLVGFAQANFPASGQPMAGTTQYFQVFYRDDASPCVALTNSTSGLAVTHTP